MTYDKNRNEIIRSILYDNEQMNTLIMRERIFDISWTADNARMHMRICKKWKNPSLSNLFSSNTNISYSLRCMCRQIKYFRWRQTHIDKQIESLDLEWHHSVGYILMYQQITYIDDFHIHKKKTRQDKTRDTKHPKNTIKKKPLKYPLGNKHAYGDGALIRTFACDCDYDSYKIIYA